MNPQEKSCLCAEAGMKEDTIAFEPISVTLLKQSLVENKKRVNTYLDDLSNLQNDLPRHLVC